jgi:hypothetical protein
MVSHLASPLTPPGLLDLHPSGYYHYCSRSFFLVLPHRQRPRRNWSSHNHRGDVSVYSIYKETHSSDDPATPERHYAGWTPNQDDAILRANEIYEGRDSTEAVLVIGNGLAGIEVVYRVGDHN